MKRIVLFLLLALAATTARAQTVPPPPPETQTDADLRAEVAEAKAQIKILQQRLDQLLAQSAIAPSPEPITAAETPGEPAPPDEANTSSAPTGAGRALLLPEISFIANMTGHLSSDRRDSDRSRWFVDSGEIAIQSYVYPNVKANAVIAADRGEDLAFGLEEGFLTLQQLGKGLSAQVGKRKVPFGRVNQLHPHSWLYTVQPYVLTNLVGAESLSGHGGFISYLLPARGKLFARLDAGLWNSAEPGEIQPEDTGDIRTGPGASFEDRFQTLRLWTGTSIGTGGELELGGSFAHGKGSGLPIGDGFDRPNTTLTGVDLSYRRFGKLNSRLLLRAEYLWHRAHSDFYRATAKGGYAFADYRLSPYRELGLRYDWSEFPYAPGLHESAVSLIGTNQLTEQTYLRLQLIQGDRPGKKNFSEAWLQWVWGMGPHTHDLE
jgi:hypothetical protein